MPELPEVETVVRELNKKLRGRVIVSVEVRAAKLVSVGPATLSPIRTTSQRVVATFKSKLIGHKILSVHRRAKILFFNLSGPYTILVHLKMTGQFIFEDIALRKKTGGTYRLLNRLNAPLLSLPGKHTHVIISFKDTSKLYFNDMRKFGYLKLIKDTEVNQVKELAAFGPEPLSRDFSYHTFRAAVKKRNKSTVKQVLMDNKVVVGIGNIYSDEILFHAKVRPTRKVGRLQEKELRAIYNQIRLVLRRGIAAKGSSVGDFVRTDGTWGTMGKYHFVYGRRKQPCKVCRTPIQSTKLGGRTSSFCPQCQK